MSSYKRFEKYRKKGSGSLIYLEGTVKSIETGFNGIKYAVVDISNLDVFSTITLKLSNFSISTIDLGAIEKREIESDCDLGYRKAQSVVEGDSIEILTKKLYSKMTKKGEIARDYTNPVAFSTGRSQEANISHFREYTWLFTYLRKAKKEESKKEKPKAQTEDNNQVEELQSMGV